MEEKNKIYAKKQLELLKYICKEKGIEIKILSYGWIICLKKENKTKYIAGNKFDLNTEAIGKIIDDKAATFEVLKENNIPAVEHIILFNPNKRQGYSTDGSNTENIKQYLEKYNKIVIKPNNGTQGIGVSLCENLKEAQEKVRNLFQENNAISICPYYNIKKEYRTFYLNGECLLTYGKTKPFVIGDGIHCIKELIQNSNLYLKENKVTKENFEKIDLNKIPKQNEKIEISWKHNLSGGAIPEIIEDNQLIQKIQNLVKQVGKTLNIKFATVDIIQTKENKWYVLEINSGIGISCFMEEVQDGYKIAKQIYERVLDELFIDC